MITGAGIEKENILQNHTHGIIENGYFGKKNKTVEEKVRCFLLSKKLLKLNCLVMLQHVDNIKANSDSQSRRLNKGSETSDDKEDMNFHKYFCCANEVCVLNTKQVDRQNLENVFHSVKEIMRDDTFIFLLDNINQLTFDEANLLYKILKTVILLTNLRRFPSNAGFSKIVETFIIDHLDQLSKILIKNLSPLNKDYVIIIVGKLFRKLFQNDSLLKSLLTPDFFSQIYSNTKNEKFVLTQESFKTLFYLINSKRVNKQTVSEFFSENARFISSVIISGVNLTGLTKHTKERECIVDDYYYMKRETLIFLEKVLANTSFEKFSIYFLNQPENLKTIMMQLNNKCEKLVFQAIDILYFFFLDIETKSKNVKLILHSNKENFYKFFEKNENVLSDSTEMMEKKNFILYELERLENFLD